MTAIPVPWNGLAVPEASGVSGRDPVGRLRGPYQLAADLPAFVIRRVEVYVGPPGLQIGDLPVGQRCRPLDRARYAAAERHQDAGIGSGSGGTVAAVATGGTSLAPLRSALKLICSARATPQLRNAATTPRTSDGAWRIFSLP